ncbi:TetR family transcriptional regulator [Aeromicrobium fastidiosum]|uniref:TetR family transcriptional regulator n=1 Tax=Aeromicrobium fastidiosum TaxID=52699 RepID=UPI00165FA21F|nr:TetR family transcriptional regulator [Aeromicrobium fastidiosum]MBP2390307.1 AcrR family transcriptional regulator [Aeromicrobium fastidiosum]
MKAKISLNRDEVVASALRIVDEQGLDALTVRRVADEFGVTPMALYWHFSNKDALLDAVGDAVVAGLRLPDLALDLEHYLGEAMTALVDVMRAHPRAASLLPHRILLTDPGREITEATLDKLMTAGFDVDKAAAVAHYAMMIATTLVAAEPGAETSIKPADRGAALEAKLALLQSLPADRYPRLRVAAPAMVECGDSDEYYADAVGIFVAGVMADARALTS